MRNDNKTLADVQPGGMVRLGDQAERVRFEEFLSGNPLIALSAGTAWQVWQAALSAQPSPATCKEGLQVQPTPGGQGDALLESLVARWRNHAEEIGVSDNLLCQKIANCTMRHAAELQAVLAARQPVTMDDALAAGDGTLHGAIDHWQGRALRAEAELAARQPVGQITGTEIDARLNALYREMVDSGQHNGGMSGVAWDRAVYRMASSQPAQAVGLAENMLSVLIEEGVLARNGRVFQKLRALIDSMAVGK